MEQIFKNIADPSWWFTGVFFVVLGIILTKLVGNWVPFLWRKMSSYMPELNRKISRWNEKRVLKDIKRNRQHDIRINWLIGRYWCLGLMYFIYMSMVFIYFALTPTGSFDESVKRLLIWVAPSYLLLFYITREKKFIFRLIRANVNWKKRITIQERRTRQRASS